MIFSLEKKAEIIHNSLRLWFHTFIQSIALAAVKWDKKKIRRHLNFYKGQNIALRMVLKLINIFVS